MNEFLNQFGNRIQSFYKDQEQEKQLLLTDILNYANLNPEEFSNQVGYFSETIH